ncbi:hypothetical protein [Natrinema amylolyticum]|nr:hypothetical protein [Natrinema amylolyticum]
MNGGWDPTHLNLRTGGRRVRAGTTVPRGRIAPAKGKRVTRGSPMLET